MSTPTLHILVITYNRAAKLRESLDALARSILCEFPITILDNCSTDDTTRVCAEFGGRVATAKLVRHPSNIGAAANYLRAVELSTGIYTWVLCDDDLLSLGNAEEVLDGLRKNSWDFFCVGGPAQDLWPRGAVLAPVDIQRRYKTFMTALSFIPAMIWRTSRFDETVLSEARRAAEHYYPTFAIARRFLLGNTAFRTSVSPLVARGHSQVRGHWDLDLIAGWAEVCRSLPTTRLRAETFLSHFESASIFGLIFDIARTTMWRKLDHRMASSQQLRRIAAATGWKGKLAVAVCIPLSLMPRALLSLLRTSYRSIKYRLLRRPLPPTFDAPLNEDPHRY